MKCIDQSVHVLAESPLWDHRENKLFWVDIEAQQVLELDIESNQKMCWNMPSQPGSIALHAQGGLLVALAQEIVQFLPSTGKILPITGLTLPKKVRFNDGKCDPQGRFWVGSMDLQEKEPIGTLYCLDQTHTLLKKAEGIIVSNGLDWSPDQTLFYFTDSARRVIYRYDFEPKTGHIQNRQIFASIPENAGYPDGLCVDQAGYIWSAHYLGGRITRYAPDGCIHQVIEIPALCPTSCCFGGISGNQLLITTASRDLTTTQRKENPLNGGIFMYEIPSVQGKKASLFSER